MQEESATVGDGQRIDSWKGVAAFLGRDERTVQRWEKERQLPVHRVPGQRGAVFAYKEELIRWLHQAHTPGVQPEPDSFKLRASSFPAESTVGFAPEVAVSSPSASSSAVSAPGRWPKRFILLASALCVVLVILGLMAWRKHPEWPGAGSQALAPNTASGHNLTNVSAFANEKDPQARDLYLRGRFFWNQRTGSGLAKALDAFSQSSVRDPSFAQAYVGLAETYELMPEFGSMPATQAFPKALTAAQRAVALDPNSADAHRVLAFALFYWEWKTSAAFEQFGRALQLAPDSALTHHWYATALVTLGRFRDAAREIGQARELDPSSRAILADQALIDSYNGADLERCIGRLRELSQAEPNFVSPARYIAWRLFESKQYARWIEQLQTIAAITHSELDRNIAQAAARGWRRGGERALFEDVFQVQQRALASGQVSGVDLAILCLKLGDREGAVRLLQAAYTARDFRLLIVTTFAPMPELKGDVVYERIRSDVTARMNSPS